MAYAPIQTWYAGHHFRSRLEARWAVFFDALGVDWEYEPEGFELPSGRYLPDFYLPDIRDGIWFEVKGDNAPDDFTDPRWPELVSATDTELVVAFGMPKPYGDHVWGSRRANGYMERYDRVDRFDPYVTWGVPWDHGQAFCICNTCGRVGIEYCARPDRICNHPGSEDRERYQEHPRIQAAYVAAKSARFEYGQNGRA